MIPASDTGAEDRIRGYLGEVAAALPGPRRRRAQILDELSDGLHQAVVDGTVGGLPTAAAVTATIERFGPPATVARAFAVELSIASARHTLAWFVGTGPLVGIWWLLLLHPRPWTGGAIALLHAIPVLPVVAVALVAAAIAFATTGQLMRWLPEASPRHAATAVLAVAALAGSCDIAVTALYLSSGRPAGPLAVVAITASLARLGFSLATARDAVAMRSRTTKGMSLRDACDARPASDRAR